MEIQEIIVGIIVLGCIIWLIARISQYIKRIKNNKATCGCRGCDTCPSSKHCKK